MHYKHSKGDVAPNWLGITDAEVLSATQQVTIAFRSSEVREGMKVIRGCFDTDHFRRTHAYILQDLYPWAGQTRQDVQQPTPPPGISRAQQRGADRERSVFAESGTVNKCLDAISADLHLEGGLRGLEQEEFVLRLATYFDRYYQVAPFRAGNEAVLSLIIEQIAKRAGYELQLDNMLEVQLAATKILVECLDDRSELSRALGTVIKPACGAEATLARRASLREEPVPFTRERPETDNTRALREAEGLYLE